MMEQVVEKSRPVREVTYIRAKYTTRLFAFAFDLLCMAITTLLLMIAVQAMLNVSPWYTNMSKVSNDLIAESCLYEKVDGSYILITKKYTASDEAGAKTVNNEHYAPALDKFYKLDTFFPNGDGMEKYNKEKVESGYFVLVEGKVVRKSDVTETNLYAFYRKAISTTAVGYMSKNVNYINASRGLFFSFLFIDLLIPIVVSTLIFELMFPFIFKHGRKTLGKLIFKIGVTDAQGLSPTIGRFLLRYLFFLFIEIILSIASFLIPLIVSFSMMAFSKKSQSLHDYVIGTYVIDDSNTKICMNKIEYYEMLEKLSGFKLEKDKTYFK